MERISLEPVPYLPSRQDAVRIRPVLILLAASTAGVSGVTAAMAQSQQVVYGDLTRAQNLLVLRSDVNRTRLRARLPTGKI
ncbi:MAG: hypothetical protein HYX74_05750 [Acidobacteria bacterium]|nr:hypothetical protein [Acidobacteriota bacterium]